MPLMKCKKGGVSGWKYGPSGRCYPGPGGKKLAIKQGLAENDGKWADASATDEEVAAAAAEMMAEGADAFVVFASEFYEAVDAHISKKERDGLKAADFGWPEERKFPIRNQNDLDAAVKLIGRAPAGKQAAIKARIKKIAARKGLKLPESWS